MIFLQKSVLALMISGVINVATAADDLSLSSQSSSKNQSLELLSEKNAESSSTPLELIAMAVKYEHAEGRPRDYEKAVNLYCRAAKVGNADAQYALGWMYANGRGVGRNDSVAAQLFTLAGEQGHQYAKEMLRFTHASAIPASLPTCMLPEKIADITKLNQTDEERKLAEIDLAATKEPLYLKGPIFNLVQKLAPIYEIDPGLALAVISVESGFNVNAKSPRNAQGLMQLIPETAQRFKVKNAFDAADNIKGGLAYLQWLLTFFKGNVSLVAAAYNAGEGAVQKYRGIPPYPETKDYVRKITRLYQKATHPYKAGQANALAF